MKEGYDPSTPVTFDDVKEVINSLSPGNPAVGSSVIPFLKRMLKPSKLFSNQKASANMDQFFEIFPRLVLKGSSIERTDQEALEMIDIIFKIASKFKPPVEWRGNRMYRILMNVIDDEIGSVSGHLKEDIIGYLENRILESNYSEPMVYDMINMRPLLRKLNPTIIKGVFFKAKQYNMSPGD